MTVRLRQDSEFRRATLGRFRLALSANDYAWPAAEKGKEIPDAVLRGLRAPEEKRTAAQKTAIATHFQWSSPEARAAAHRTREAAAGTRPCSKPRSRASSSPKPPRRPRPAFSPRGNWMDDQARSSSPRSRHSWASWRRGPASDAAGSGELARLAGKSADRAGIRESHVEAVLRHGHIEVARRSRIAGRVADASRAARLARGRVHATGM